jgi:hypothetical protein
MQKNRNGAGANYSEIYDFYQMLKSSFGQKRTSGRLSAVSGKVPCHLGALVRFGSFATGAFGASAGQCPLYPRKQTLIEDLINWYKVFGKHNLFGSELAELREQVFE